MISLVVHRSGDRRRTWPFKWPGGSITLKFVRDSGGHPVNDKQSWWQTLPGILTATATLLTAIGGLLALLAQLGIIGGSDSREPQVSPGPVAPAPQTDPDGPDTIEKRFPGDPPRDP